MGYFSTFWAISTGLAYCALLYSYFFSPFKQRFAKECLEFQISTPSEISLYISNAFTAVTVVFVVYAYINDTIKWPKYFPSAVAITSVSKFYNIGVTASLFPSSKSKVDWIQIFLAQAFSQCLIALSLNDLDSKNILTSWWQTIIFLMSSIANMVGVFAVTFGASNWEYLFVPFLILLYGTVLRWIVYLFRSHYDPSLKVYSSNEEGILTTLCGVFIFPNMCHLFPRLFLMAIDSHYTLFTGDYSFIFPLQVMSTTIAYGLGAYALARINQRIDIDNKLDQIEEEQSNRSAMLDEEIVHAARSMCSQQSQSPLSSTKMTEDLKGGQREENVLSIIP